MLKWYGDSPGDGAQLPFTRCSILPSDQDPDDSGFAMKCVFECATRWLEKLHCHTSVMAPGAGYEPHLDGYDVVMIILEGQLESLGERLTPHGAFPYAAGGPPREPPRRRGIVDKLTNPRRWRRRFQRLARWLGAPFGGGIPRARPQP